MVARIRRRVTLVWHQAAKIGFVLPCQGAMHERHVLSERTRRMAHMICWISLRASLRPSSPSVTIQVSARVMAGKFWRAGVSAAAREKRVNPEIVDQRVSLVNLAVDLILGKSIGRIFVLLRECLMGQRLFLNFVIFLSSIKLRRADG